MNDAGEKLALAIDRVDNLASGLSLPVPHEMHVFSLKQLIPEIVDELKAAFVDLTGENPWE